MPFRRNSSLELGGPRRPRTSEAGDLQPRRRRRRGCERKSPQLRHDQAIRRGRDNWVLRAYPSSRSRTDDPGRQGAGLPRGADDRYWGAPGLPSVFKHTLLDKYVPQFAGMTGSRAQARRVVFLDGYAGRGRYQNGSPASAERILKIAQHQGATGTVSWTCFFVEREDDDAAQLAMVVDEYARQGVTATAHHGSVLEVLGDVIHTATGCPLFLFL